MRCRAPARDTLHPIMVKHFSQKLGKKGPLHDGYMRAFPEIFFASQASEHLMLAKHRTVPALSFLSPESSSQYSAGQCPLGLLMNGVVCRP